MNRVISLSPSILFICLSSSVSIYLSLCLPIFLSLSIFISLSLPIFFLSVSLPLYLFIYLSVCLFFLPFLSLSLSLSLPAGLYDLRRGGSPPGLGFLQGVQIDFSSSAVLPLITEAFQSSAPPFAHFLRCG